MDNTAARKPKWELTAAALDALLRWLDADSDHAARKYEETRRSLMRFFESRGCLTPDEQTDETIDRVARRVSEGVEIYTTNPFLYFYGVALKVLQEYQRKQRVAATVELPPAADSGELHQRLDCMDTCIETLPAESAELLVEYCQFDKDARTEGRKQIAERLGVTLNTLRLRVHRLREQLEDCVIKCVKKARA